MLFVVPEAALAAGGPADLGVEPQGTEGIAGFPVGGPCRGCVDRHAGAVHLHTAASTQVPLENSHKNMAKYSPLF